MHDDEYLTRGLPIGTGVVEGACGHLVKDRMEQSGMRWTKTGAQAVLDLRAVRMASGKSIGSCIGTNNITGNTAPSPRHRFVANNVGLVAINVSQTRSIESMIVGRNLHYCEPDALPL